MSITEPPTRADLLAYLKLSDPGGGPDDEYGLAVTIAVAGQQHRCVVDPYDPQLHAAALRRAARWLAARGHALGVVDMGDYAGIARISRWDSEADAYEAPFLRGGFA